MVHDNYFHECRCHGVWLNAPYGLIDHNSMYGNTEGAIGFAGGAGAGPGATNLSITHSFMNHPGDAVLRHAFTDRYDCRGKYCDFAGLREDPDHRQ